MKRNEFNDAILISLIDNKRNSEEEIDSGEDDRIISTTSSNNIDTITTSPKSINTSRIFTFEEKSEGKSVRGDPSYGIRGDPSYGILSRIVHLQSQSYFSNGNPLLAACCFLSINDAYSAVQVLMRGSLEYLLLSLLLLYCKIYYWFI